MSPEERREKYQPVTPLTKELLYQRIETRLFRTVDKKSMRRWDEEGAVWLMQWYFATPDTRVASVTYTHTDPKSKELLVNNYYLTATMGLGMDLHHYSYSVPPTLSRAERAAYSAELLRAQAEEEALGLTAVSEQEALDLLAKIDILPH